MKQHLLLSLLLVFLNNQCILSNNSKEIVLDQTPILSIAKPKAKKPMPTIPSGVVIIIHGTFAESSDWYQPSGDFFETIKKQAILKNYNTISFTWSGKATHAARIRAAKNLAELITSYPPSTQIQIIAHSHGANVVNLASSLLFNPIEAVAEQNQNFPSIEGILSNLKTLKKEKETMKKELEKEELSKISDDPIADFYKTIKQKFTTLQKELIAQELTEYSELIKELQEWKQLKKIKSPSKNKINCAYFLAAPIDETQYPPNYFVIQHLKNFYSEGDVIQTVFGSYKRIFTLNSQVINIAVTTQNTKKETSTENPGHSALHSPAIAHWLLDIFESLKKKKIGEFEKAQYGINGKIIFFNDFSSPYFLTI